MPRRLTRLNATVLATLSAMKKGQALHRHHAWYGAAWFLTDGRTVPAEIAEIVIKNKQIASVGDSLFADTPAQTYRWISPS
jgi:hypothetical protein